MSVARAAATLAAGAAVWLGACGFIKVAPTSAQQKALAEHYTNNDPIWLTLATAAVTEDKAKGAYDAAFPPAVTALGGTEVVIRGFMTPLEPQARVRHFILTRRSTVCPFCPPNAPTEAVEVRLPAAIPVTAEEVAVTGRLLLTPASDAGLFYSLPDARPAPPRSAGPRSAGD